MNQPLSCIIVNRNTADLLLQCVENLYRSDLPQPPEIIVVDNGSSDDSVARMRSAHPEVTIIEAGRNLGFAAANNRAIDCIRGPYIMLVNTDAMPDKDCAGRLIRLMESDDRIGMAGPQLLNADGTVQTSYEAVPTLVSETLNRSLLKRLFPKRFPHKSRKLDGPIEVEALIGAVMMLRRAAVQELGGFDENYFFFLEETDLAVGMKKAGWKVIHEPCARAVHLQGATAKTYLAEARIEFYRSRYIFFRKHYGSAAVLILKTVMILNLMLNVIGLGLATLLTLGRVASVKERFRVRYRLWKWHLAGCPQGWGLPRD